MKNAFPSYTIGQFVNQPNNKTEFEMLRFETMEEPEVEEFHKHAFYEILWTAKGSSRQIIDYKEYEVKPCSLFFISPNQLHHFEEWKPLQGGTILFTEDFYLLNRSNRETLFELSFLDNLYANPCIKFNKKEFAEILSVIQKIEAEHSRKDKSLNIIQAYLHILLAQVQRHVDTENLNAGSKRYLIVFKQFKQSLEQHFIENHRTSFYAKSLHLSPHHLNLVCTEIANKTATEIITERRVLEAKRLLTFTNKTISEIAFELNFNDSSYFAKIFKDFTNLPPKDFREQMSEKYRRR